MSGRNEVGPCVLPRGGGVGGGVSVVIVPAWLGVVCAPLSSVKTPSGRRRRPERISPVPPASSAALSAPGPGSSGWDLDRASD